MLGAAHFCLCATQSQIAAVIFVAFCAAGAVALLRARVVRRWAHWEFWPARLFYLPVAAYYCWLALRYRSFTLPSAANPGMPTGGFVGESKYAIIDVLQRAHPIRSPTDI